MVKWVFLSLFMMNLLMAGVQWNQYRLEGARVSYVEPADVSRIRLLRDSFGAEAGEPECLLLGPFEEESYAQQLRVILGERGYPAELVAQSIKRAPSFWVYSGPFDTDEERAQRFAEFQSKGIDSFIIRRGLLAGNISVGVFENIDSAKRMLSRMRSRGYQVSMRPLSRQRVANWLLVESGKNKASAIEIRSIFKGLTGIPESRQIFCKSVASPK